MFWIYGLPIPPSANSLYETNVNKKWVKRNGSPFLKVSTSKRCSDELKVFKTRCELFKRQHSEKFNQFSLQCMNWVNQGYVLRMDSYCIFEHSRIWTKDNKPKQLDADNRRKALQDAVFELLNIDDKHVFCGNIEKATCDNKDLECSIIKISPVMAKNLSDIKKLMASL
jgi:Holliday junction resolvase RusA-like endonuclease